MLDLERETDPKRLRQIAQAALADNDRLVKRIVKLTRELAEMRGKSQQDLALEMQHLQEQLAELKATLYGRSSERRDSKKPRDDDKKPQRGHGPREQTQLECLVEVHELAEEDLVCPHCGSTIEEWEGQDEQTEEIDVIERKIVIRKHHKKKYRCGVCHAHVETAPGPPRLTPGGRYSTDFAIEVAVGKFVDHLPLERQVRIMKREGLQVDSQTLWDQILALSNRLRSPVYNALGRYVLSSAVVHADETTWRMLSKGNKKAWYLWGVSRLDAAHYKILDSRSLQAGGEVLGDYDGIVVCDGYDVYSSLAQKGPVQVELDEQEQAQAQDPDKKPTKAKRSAKPAQRKAGKGFTNAGCWAHARRKIVQAEAYEPEACKELIDLIGKLFDVERQVPFVPSEGDELAKQLALRSELRERVSKGVVDDIYQWAVDHEGQFLPRSKMGKAVTYLVNQKKPLKVFLSDPRVPIDNNRMERGLRGPVLGRKNYYGTKSKRGAEVAAVFYSTFESCKLAGVEPKEYLRYVTHLLLSGEKKVPLPHEYAKLRTSGEIPDPGAGPPDA
ncbi:MAG: IS66 family transposase [Planctomycetota bacterium]|jgi:transposase